jgi:hypothetical protein
MGNTRIALVAVALAWPLAACGDTGASTTATAPVTASVTTGTPNASAPAALQFSAPSVGGGAIDFTQFAGTPVVLWFWAPT